VLVVDDNPTNRCILEHYLHHEGASYVSAASARAGLDAARTAAASGVAFDVVLLDYQMPEMDGVGFLRELRKDASICATRCVVLSSLGDRVSEVQPLGVEAWLTKPVRRAQLQALMSDFATGQGTLARVPVQQKPVTSHYAGARVLLVEDNRVNQEVALRTLRSFGIEAQVANNGAQALARVQESTFDLVLMDCQMPVMDGYESTRRIRAWEGANHVPIVAMTANALHGDREKCLEAGMDDYLSKPIKRDVLALQLAKWLPAQAAHATTATTSEPMPVHGSRNESALDMSVLAELADLMGEGLESVIATYLSDTPSQLTAIQAAIERGEYEVITRCAHSLKSSSLSLGVTVLSRAAEALEMLGHKAGSLHDAEKLLSAMWAAHQAAQTKLQEIATAAAIRFPNAPDKHEQVTMFVKHLAMASGR
jgi:CheY-like chemotaxis protein/HPt (histidine-containing phosphotransfer) domain-containing protein